MENDVYFTLNSPGSEAIFKDKGSKFFGYAFPVRSEDEVTKILGEIRTNHHKARHWCYAYKLGFEQNVFRVNDDGEPSNSAGMPIYGQIQSFDLTDVLIVVVRYFGGVKLGVGGLINAYRSTAKIALENSQIISKTLNNSIRILFDYQDLNKVMKIIKDFDLEIQHQTMHLQCDFEITVRQRDFDKVFEILKELRVGEVTKLG